MSDVFKAAAEVAGKLAKLLPPVKEVGRKRYFTLFHSNGYTICWAYYNRQIKIVFREGVTGVDPSLLYPLYNDKDKYEYILETERGNCYEQPFRHPTRTDIRQFIKDFPKLKEDLQEYIEEQREICNRHQKRLATSRKRKPGSADKKIIAKLKQLA